MIEEKAPGHSWTPWKYDRHQRRWFRHCVFGGGFCTAMESVPRGMKPKAPSSKKTPR